jgi:aminopeptidase-like protein
MTCQCEPQLGKRGLYPTISYKGSHDDVNVIRDFTAYADGSHDLIDVSNIINVPINVLIDIKNKLQAHDLLSYKASI